MAGMKATTTPINDATGAVLSAVLKACKMSQKDLAARLGLSPVTVSRYFNGTREVCMSTLFQFAEVTGVPASDIVERIGRELADPIVSK